MKLYFQHKLLYLVIFAHICANFAQKSRRLKYCHINQWAKCFDDMRYFAAKVNGTGIIINENEMNFSCGQQKKILDGCAAKWFKRCGNAMHYELFLKLLRRPVEENLDQLCDPDLPMRKTFLKQSPCLHYKVKMLPEYRRTCVKDLQAGYEYMQDTFKFNITQQFQSICCVYNRWEKCITDLLIEKCGPQQDQSIRILIGSATTHLLAEFCNFKRFDPTSDLCLKYFQPTDMIPLGLKSNSYPSWFFSYSCPNIGYGIIPEEERVQWNNFGNF